jgi:hypothetical protein
MMGSLDGGSSFGPEVAAAAHLLTLITDPDAVKKRLDDLKLILVALDAKSIDVDRMVEEAKKLSAETDAKAAVISKQYAEIQELKTQFAYKEQDLASREGALQRNAENVRDREVTLTKRELNLDARETALKAATQDHDATVKNFKVSREQSVAARLTELDAEYKAKAAALAVKEKELSAKLQEADQAVANGNAFKAEYERRVSALKAAMQ